MTGFPRFFRPETPAHSRKLSGNYGGILCTGKAFGYPPMWFSDAFVDGLDLAAAGFGRVVPKVTGRPAYYRHRKVVFLPGLPNL